MRAIKSLFLALLMLCPWLVEGQIPAPQIPLTGNIGSSGFPILNSGTLIMGADANRNMTAVETSAVNFKVTSSVALTATRNLVTPVGRFAFTVENATTGGQSIQIIGQSGTGITIANGSTSSIWNDGTNFVAAGTGSTDYVQTNPAAGVSQVVAQGDHTSLTIDQSNTDGSSVSMDIGTAGGTGTEVAVLGATGSNTLSGQQFSATQIRTVVQSGTGANSSSALFQNSSSTDYTPGNISLASNQSSPTVGLGGTYVVGGSQATTDWQWQDVVGTGSTPTEILTLSHTGNASGTKTVSMPFTVGLGFGSTVNNSSGTAKLICLVDGTNCPTATLPGLGVVATRGYINQAFLTGTNSWISSRTFHIARDTIAAETAQVLWTNYYATAAAEVSDGTGTFKASIEYPAGTLTPCTFSGATTKTVTGSVDVITDACGPSIPNGATFWVRMLYTNSAGFAYNSGNPNTDPRQYVSFGTGTPTDCTTSGAASTCGTNNNGNVFPPTAILAPTTKPSEACIGDSRCYAVGDTPNNAFGDAGEFQRSVGPVMGYIVMGVPSAQAAGNTTNYTNRQRLFQYVSGVVDEYCINDLSVGTTAATCAGYRTTFAGMTPKPMYGLTLFPETTSTDNWATIANQTNTTDPTAFNALVTAGIPGEVGYFDVAKVLDPPLNSTGTIVTTKKFPVGPIPGQTTGTANWSTADGVHLNTQGAMFVWQSGVINPSYFKR